jgi:hypothetical protein
VVLETLRGNDCAEVTVGIDNYPYASGYSGSRNTCDIGSSLANCANPHRIGLACDTYRANIDVVAARGEVGSGIKPQRSVE